MATLKVSEGIVPLSDFKSRAAHWLDAADRTGQPIVITQNGRAAAVLLSPQAYDRLAEQAEFRTAVSHGLHDADHGRVVGHDALVAETEARYGEPAE